MTGTTKLKLWNDALAELGQSAISATGEEGVAPAAFWDAHDRTVLYCLEQGYWNFATRTTILATQGAVGFSATGGGGEFGYTYPFVKPTGWLRTVTVSTNEGLWPPFEQYEDANNQLHADVSPLYMSYITQKASTVSDGLTVWPESFSTYVSCELAKRICRRIGGAADEYAAITERCKMTMADALSKDATAEGVRYPPENRWATSRRGGRRGDRGRRGGSLTG